MKNAIIVFSGHMIDSQDREIPRFPQSLESKAKLLIYQKLSEIKPIELGIASAASGGDILFHECCIALGIPSEIMLPSAIDVFRKSSVDQTGLDWPARYDQLINSLPIHYISPNRSSSEQNVYAQANTQMLDLALRSTTAQVTLLVLINEQQASKKGGTVDMVNEARSMGIRIEKLDLANLLY